jgi:hypothetical protein
MLLLSTLGLGQQPVPVTEPAAQAQKLLTYALQLDLDAKRAVTAGKARIAPQLKPMGTGAQTQSLDPSVEQMINQRAADGNGIYVDTPKVYDDSLLRQLLGSAQSRLMALQGFDQSGLTKAIGNITGANQQIASFGASGGVQPPVTITAAGIPVSSPFTVPSPTAPPPTTALPTSQAPSASDILNEQLQITSEIANLSLLLEGSISDQIVVGPNETFSKPRVTLGFPVVISPEKRYKNAVAVVEVFAETDKGNDASANGEAPSITALLPREKTYNVAAISDKSLSLGTGIATLTAGASANFLFGHKQYFVVKDQDTLGVQFKPAAGEITARRLDEKRLRAFAWQFRPVLGRAFVQAGSRQVFVQLAFPGLDNPMFKTFGQVQVRTYWRMVDPKTGVLKEVVPGSVHDGGFSPILNYDLRQKYGAVAAFAKYMPNAMEDLGNGKMLIKLDGRLLPGTYIRVGSTTIQPGGGGAPSDLNTTRFVADIADLIRLKTFVVSRDGTEWQLQIHPGKTNAFSVDRYSVSTLDDSTLLLQAYIKDFVVGQDIPPVLVIGGKVFGYSDAPIDRDCNPQAGTCKLSVAVPKDLLVASPRIFVKALMLDEEDGLIQPELKHKRVIEVYPQAVAQEKLVYVSQDAKNATFLLYGHALDGAKVIWPAGVQIITQPPLTNDGSMRLMTIPLDLAKGIGGVILQRTSSSGDERPFQIAVPAPPKADGSSDADAKAPKFQDRVVVSADEATIVGDKLTDIKSVSFKGQPLKIDSQSAAKIKISGLAAAKVTAVAKSQEITLTTLAGESKIPLEVVSSKIEVTQKQ